MSLTEMADRATGGAGGPVPTLDTRDLGLTYASGAQRVEAIHSVSLAIAEGEFVTIVGPSGCGKSSFLKIVYGLLPPTVGTTHDLRHAGERPAPRCRHGVPVARAAAVAHHHRERAAAGRCAAAGPDGAARARVRAAGHGRAGGLRECLSAPSLGRHAAAGRHRPRAGPRSQAAAHGRAFRRARCPHPRADVARAAAHLDDQPQDHPVRHPQHPRGGAAVRPHRPHVGAARAASCASSTAASSGRARSTISPRPISSR